MSELLQVSDFDFQIGEVLLVHKNSLVHNFRWTAYRTGRRMDGLVLCISGRAIFDLADETFELGAGQAVYLPANSSYTMRCTSAEPFVHYTANFKITDASFAEASAVSEILAGRLLHLTEPSSVSLFRECFERLLSVWQGKRSGWQVMAKSILYELLYLYLNDAGRQIRSSDVYAKLHPAKSVLDSIRSAEYTMSELAGLCGMSETHFRRLFTQLFGMTPTEYRMEKRILRAKDLLVSGQYTVTEAAAAAGFSDPSYFAKVFRRHTGASPRDFLHG